MKKVIKEEFPYKITDIRIVKKFLWMPKTLHIKNKTSGPRVKRWFERVEITQQLQNIHGGWLLQRNNSLWPKYKTVWVDKWWNDISNVKNVKNERTKS